MRKSSTAGVSSLFLSVSFYSFISPAAMASKFRALEVTIEGLPYATIPSHYFFYQKLFGNAYSVFFRFPCRSHFSHLHCPILT